MNAKVLRTDMPEGAVAPWIRDLLRGEIDLFARGGKPIVWTPSSTLAMLEEAGWRCTAFSTDGADTGRMEIQIVMVRGQACVFAGVDCAGEVTTDNPYDAPWCEAHGREFEEMEADMCGLRRQPPGDVAEKPTLAEVLAR